MHRSKGSALAVATISALSLTSCGGSGGPEAGISTPVETSGASGTFANRSVVDVQQLDLSGPGTTLDFDSSPGDEYLVIVNSVTRTAETPTFQISKGNLAGLTLDLPSLELETSEPAADFHQYLREMEQMLPGWPGLSEVPRNDKAALTTPPAVGSVNSFRILSTMNSITTCAQVSAELRLVTNKLLIFVDQNATLSNADVETLAYNFEQIALPREEGLFGTASDLNGDGHITIVMSPVVNQMAATGGLVTGFFFPGDLYQNSTVNPCSNAQEIFYTLVPDPSGRFGTPISAGFAVKNIIPGVLAHEYQHMASFNSHVFRNHGTTEESWLNECLAHLAEDLTGFGNENPSRAKLFLAQTSKTPVIPVTAPNLAERGACYLFLRYLYEQSSDADGFIRRLLDTNLTGVTNLQTAFQGTDPSFDEYPEFANRWSTALSLAGTGVTSDPRYRYQERSADSQTGNFTGICIRCDTQDGRGTVLDGPVMTTVQTYPSATTIKGTASQIYRLQNPSGSIRLFGGTGSEWVGTLVRLKEN